MRFWIRLSGMGVLTALYAALGTFAMFSTVSPIIRIAAFLAAGVCIVSLYEIIYDIYGWRKNKVIG